MPQRIVITLIFVIAVVTNAMAQESTKPTTSPSETADATVTATTSPSIYNDSAETREAFLAVLNKYPPEVSRVLKLDPSLFDNQTYLGNYPALATFVGQHPEIAHTPSFYLENIWVPGDSSPETSAERVWRKTMEGVSIFTVMMVVAGAFIWLIRTLIEHRRWSRLTRTQAEVHNKLLDRFTSNEEVLAYMQTTGGKRFLESAPIPLDAGPRSVSAPIGRILWSVQAGLIVAAAGVGLQYISRSIEKTVAQPLMAMGVLGIAVGIGFLVSAFVSFLLSKRLGLLGHGANGTAASE
jgi:hypothetical protein